ncbi:hypothetical protein IFM47457_02083 [Aspergillus lentulus]|nr:hypothetical protein IFM47457_02083 [Aspergillus lentulus]
MAQYERHQNQYRRGFVHVQALRRMVQLQGGLLQVSKSHHILVQKMLRYALQRHCTSADHADHCSVDLEYALQLGSSTLFSLEDAISENRIINELYGDNRHKHAGSSNSYQSPLIGSLRRDIQDIFIEVTSLASMLNDATNGVGPKLKSCAFHSDLLVLGYRLGNMYTLGGCRPKCPIENAIHLGLTAFLITFLPGLDHRIAHNALLSNLLLSVAQDLADDGLDIREILLWMLYIGAASSSQLGTHPTWISKSKETIDTLKLRTWEQVQDVLAKYPWVNAVHDTAGKTLWHQSRVNSLPKN